MKDCIIIGGGPAGLAAALYLGRFLRSVTLFDAGKGRARTIPMSHNLPGFPQGIAGRDLLARMRAQAVSHGAAIFDESVLSIERTNGAFLIRSDHRTEAARTLILACGVVNHRPPLSDAAHDLGVAQGLIRYCPICDAYEVRGRDVAVLGNTPHAMNEARFVRDYAASVTLLSHDSIGLPNEGGVTVLDTRVTGIDLARAQVRLTLQTHEVRQFDTLYVALGTTFRTRLAHSLGVVLSSGGGIRVDAKQRTNIPNVYAVGDVTDGLDQIAVAMGHAAIAATAIHNEARQPERC